MMELIMRVSGKMGISLEKVNKYGQMGLFMRVTG